MRILFWALAYSSLLWGNDWYLKKGDQRVIVPLFQLEKSWVNDICYRDQKNCQALQKLKNPLKQKFAPNFGNPAQEYCLLVQGIPIVLFSSASSRSFCLFSDKTLISSWHLYRGAAP